MYTSGICVCNQVGWTEFWEQEGEKYVNQKRDATPEPSRFSLQPEKVPRMREGPDTTSSRDFLKKWARLG